MRIVFALLTLILITKTCRGAEKPIDPVVALAWCSMPAKPADRFTATDGNTYERGADGIYRQVASGPAAPRATSGCGCTASVNCGAPFCKSQGGTGCPASCPVKAKASALPVSVDEVWATDQTGQKVKVLVEGRVDPNRDGAVEASYPRTFGTPMYSLPQASSGGCAGGNCPAQSSRQPLFPRLRGW
jgi:hypothetical protein